MILYDIQCLILQSSDACREKDEMACRSEKWSWKKVKSYFLDAVTRRHKGNDVNNYPGLDQRQSSISNCCWTKNRITVSIAIIKCILIRKKYFHIKKTLATLVLYSMKVSRIDDVNFLFQNCQPLKELRKSYRNLQK